MTSKALKREQARQELLKQGYHVYWHHQTPINTERMLQIAINQISTNTKATFKEAAQQIKTQLNAFNSHSRVGLKNEQPQWVNVNEDCFDYNIETGQSTQTNPDTPTDKHK